jgi:predicted phage tail protein
MFVKVKFHGILKKLCPKIYEVDAQTPAEALRGLTNQLPQLKRKDGKLYQCQVRECRTKESLFSTFGDLTELNVYPSFIASGGGGNPWVMILVGALLITAAIVTGGAAMAAVFAGTAAGWTAVGAAAAFATVALGAGMVVAGLSQLLTPTPKVSNTQESQVAESRFFNSNQNTTAIGTRIAVAYGRNKIYGQLLSFNTQAVDRG